MVWAFFFITNKEESTPKLKARSFVKTVQAGRNIVRRGTGLSAVSSTVAAQANEWPGREPPSRGDDPTFSPSSLRPVGSDPRAAGSDTPASPPGLPFVDNGSVISATRRRTAITSSASHTISPRDLGQQTVST